MNKHNKQNPQTTTTTQQTKKQNHKGDKDMMIAQTKCNTEVIPSV